MNTRVQCGVTAGLAIVGASVLAVAPLSLPMPSATSPVNAEVELTATATPLEQAAALVQGFAESGTRAGSGAALAPLSPVLAGTALAFGDNNRAYSIIRQSIDAPLWAADPTINALAAALPAPIGGGEADNEGGQPGDGALVQFRDDVLWATTNAVRTQIQGLLGADDSLTGRNFTAELGAGLDESGLRLAEGSALAPLGLIPIAQAIAGGSEQDLYNAIRQYIDAPLWVADPTIKGLAASLPKPLGGGVPDENPGAPGEDGTVVQFRDNVLWGTTNATRTAVANVLGAEANPASVNNSIARTSATSEKDNRVLGSVNLGRFAPGSSNGSGSTVSAQTADRPQPVRAAVKAINDQVKAGADRLDSTVKNLSGTGADTSADNG